MLYMFVNPFVVELIRIVGEGERYTGNCSNVGGVLVKIGANGLLCLWLSCS